MRLYVIPPPGTCIQACPHQTYACGPIFLTDLSNMTTTRHMHGGLQILAPCSLVFNPKRLLLFLQCFVFA
jgi:hypothetical protein